MIMLSAIIANTVKNLTFTGEIPNISVAQYRGLSVPWSVVDSGKVFKELCVCGMFLLPGKSFWLLAITL